MRRMAWVALLGVLSGCVPLPTGAKWELVFSALPRVPIAVGTEHDVVVFFTKDCAMRLEQYGAFGEPCIDSAHKEVDVSVTGLKVGDPTVLAATPRGNTIHLRALRAGTSTFEVTVRNSKRRELSYSGAIQVAPATAVRALLVPKGRAGGCLFERKPAELWFKVGESFRLRYQLLGGDRELLGPPFTVAASGGPGFTQRSYAAPLITAGLQEDAYGEYVLTQPGRFQLTSGRLPVVPGAGGAYTCETITGVSLRAFPPRDGRHGFDVAHMVGDSPVCTEPPPGCRANVSVGPPEVCGVDPEYRPKTTGGRFTVLERKPGTCRITAGLEGAPPSAQLEFVVGP